MGDIFQYIVDFLGNLDLKVETWYEWLILRFTLFTLEAKMAALAMASNIGQVLATGIIDSVGLSSFLSQLDEKINRLVYLLKIPEAFNIVLTAYMARYVKKIAVWLF